MTQTILIDVLNSPQITSQLENSQWGSLISQARAANLLSRLYSILEQKHLFSSVPEHIQHHLLSAHKQAEKQHRQVLWEVSLLSRTFKDLEIQLLLLKGSAYIYGELPASCGRTLSDIDILVPKEVIEKVEKRLFLDGFMSTKIDDYDQHYYREWMHEIPPLQHYTRGTTLDVHHNILPTLKRTLNPEKLFEEVENISLNVAVLSKYDRILHSAAHLFMEGEFPNGLRDLHDLHLMFSKLNGADDWLKIKSRASELNLTFPLFYATRYCRMIFNTNIPEKVDFSVFRAHDNVLLKLKDWLFTQVLRPHHHSAIETFFKLAEVTLLVRAHFLKMPIKILAPHLFKKSISAIIESFKSSQIHYKN
ncbi:MAG: nucleotidyltransferase family protein [Motiliproteus sp.]|nr:nucleotidyltransferase family protein [Motiliproteus sp.]MCW9053306.1 nucleotidyltransferase family protein [Motiliproteus sp.]